jgi:hypothetical protein
MQITQATPPAPQGGYTTGTEHQKLLTHIMKLFLIIEEIGNKFGVQGVTKFLLGGIKDVGGVSRSLKYITQ